jgi:hypothetical protein
MILLMALVLVAMSPAPAGPTATVPTVRSESWWSARSMASLHHEPPPATSGRAHRGMPGVRVPRLVKRLQRERILWKIHSDTSLRAVCIELVVKVLESNKQTSSAICSNSNARNKATDPVHTGNDTQTRQRVLGIADKAAGLIKVYDKSLTCTSVSYRTLCAR